MFIGRKEELQILESKINSDSFEFGIIYGRRRIGKTHLLLEARKNHNAIYYVANELGLEQNIKGISNAIANYYDIPLSFDNLESIFIFLAQESRKKEIIFILDDFTYLIKHEKGVLSVLQNIVDHILLDSKVKLILSDSHVGMVEDVLSYKKPLYGRTTFKMKLKPFDYYEASLFYPNFSSEDKVRLYSVFGGIPFYLSKIDNTISVEDNIKLLIINNGAALEEETTFFLSQEVRSITSYANVLTAIASGATRYNEIQTKSKISSSGSLATYLETLTELGIIEKERCFKDSSNKKSIYVIKDQLFRFHYQFIEKNQSAKSIMEPNAFYDSLIKPYFEEYVSIEFERICLQFLVRKHRNTILDIGRYWYNNKELKKEIEIDIVLLTLDGISTYEVKWTNSKVDHRIASTLIEVSKDLNPNSYGLFSKSGYTDIETREDFILYNPDDIYSL